MQNRRNNALTDLKHLTENLTKCMKVLFDKSREEELNKVWAWVNNDGPKSSLPEINKWIESIKLKVL